MSNFEIVHLCKQWQGKPKTSDREMEELRFFEPSEIDLNQISPPIRKVVSDYITRNIR